MTLYEKIALVAFLFLLVFPRNSKHQAGSILLAIVWPVLPVALVYFGCKKLLTGRGVSARFEELEISACMVAGCLLVPAVMYFQGDPLICQAVRSIWG